MGRGRRSDPAGATVLGRGLGGDSQTLTQGERTQGWAWPAFERARASTAYRAYYRYVPKGRFVAEYTVRLNNPGTFQLPPTRVEAMYAPEMFGESRTQPVVVEPTTVNVVRCASCGRIVAIASVAAC